MEECQEQNSRPPWSPFGQVNGPNSAQKAPGLQVSQLSHLLQQNGSSTLVRHPIPPARYEKRPKHAHNVRRKF